MNNNKKRDKLGQKEVYELITKDEVGWKAIIYDLINTEQLDPWDIDLISLANKYLEKIKNLEETDFFISSKVLLAASLLLKIKTQVLLDEYIKSIDEILFGKKEEEKTKEDIDIDKSKLPDLNPKTPLPRYRRVSLDELMNSLNKAMKTEERRIKKKIKKKQLKKETEIVLPKEKPDIKDRIKRIYSQILESFKKKKSKISYSELTGDSRDEKIACFLPCLHLDNQHKLFLEQEDHLGEIWLWIYKHYKEKKYAEKGEKSIPKRKKKVSEVASFDNPLANFFNSTLEG